MVLTRRSKLRYVNIALMLYDIDRVSDSQGNSVVLLLENALNIVLGKAHVSHPYSVSSGKVYCDQWKASAVF